MKRGLLKALGTALLFAGAHSACWWLLERWGVDRLSGLLPGLPRWPGLALGALQLVAWTPVLIAALVETAGDREPSRGPLTTGPFACLRHPVLMGLASVSAGVGLTLDLSAPVAAGLIWLLVGIPVVLARERREQRRWGPAYDAYRRLTPAFLPHPFRRNDARSRVIRLRGSTG